jgi:CheY-like chemotaxis protein
VSRGLILIADDNKLYRRTLEHECCCAGYDVITAADGEQALNAALTHPVEVMILDIMMPKMTGLAVCREIRQDASKAEIPVIILSARGEADEIDEGYDAGASYYQTKPPDDRFLKTHSLNELMACLRRHLIDYRLRVSNRVVVAIDLPDSGSPQYMIEGAVTVHDTGLPMSLDRTKWQTDMADIADDFAEYHTGWLKAIREGDEADAANYTKKRDKWRRQAIDKGRELSKLLFETNPNFMQVLGQGQLAAGEDQHLAFHFSGPRQNLALPFELLHAENTPLALRYPMSRQVNHKTTHQKWRAFLKQHKGKTIRALLLASGETDNEPSVAEIEGVALGLRAAMERVDVNVSTAPEDLSRPISFEEATQLLEQKSFHLIHFAGHGAFNSSRPEESFLWFPTGELRATRLAGLLRDSKTEFLYLSCCSGAEIGEEVTLADNAYLGLMDAAVQAGVPAVLGHRWSVVGRSACSFAAHVYEGLARYPSSFEHAVWWARNQVFQTSTKGGWDETWFSPMLVVQNPDYPGDSYA